MADCADSPPSPSPSSPMIMDSSDCDSALAKSEWLSRREVLERRSRRVKQLARLYRHHYWALMEDLKAKHREYYWTYGKSPFKEDQNNPSPANCTDGTGVENRRLALGSIGDDIKRCHVANCKTKAMALSKFCHAHILSDPHQKLYKGCTYVLKRYLFPSFFFFKLVDFGRCILCLVTEKVLEKKYFFFFFFNFL